MNAVDGKGKNSQGVISIVVDALNSSLGWLGSLLGAMSLISVVVRITQVGLKPVLQEFVEFYRSLLNPIMEAFNLFLPFNISPIVADIAIIYIVFFGMSLRTMFNPRGNGQIPSRATAIWEIPVLWPVLTLKPLRRYIFHRNGYNVNQARWTDLKTNRYPTDSKIPSSQEVDAHWAWSHSLEASNIFRIQFIQMLLVPFALVIFFLLNYAP